MALIFYITQVQFDFGAVKLLEQECRRVGIKRPLIVTDKGIVAAGLENRVSAEIKGKLDFAMFDETPGNPILFV